MTTPSSQVPRPGAVVAAAADGQQQAVVAGEADRRRDVVGVGAAGDQRRPLVDHGVVDRARLVVVGVAGPDQPAPEPGELLAGGLRGRGHRAHASPLVVVPAKLAPGLVLVMTRTDRLSSRLDLRPPCRDDQV